MKFIGTVYGGAYDGMVITASLQTLLFAESLLAPVPSIKAPARSMWANGHLAHIESGVIGSYRRSHGVARSSVSGIRRVSPIMVENPNEKRERFAVQPGLVVEIVRYKSQTLLGEIEIYWCELNGKSCCDPKPIEHRHLERTEAADHARFKVRQNH